jgi:hypothetical protein
MDLSPEVLTSLCLMRVSGPSRSRFLFDQTVFGGAGVEDLGDAGVAHSGECLPLVPEPGDDEGSGELARMSLSATDLRMGSICSASQTTPTPPLPIWRMRV